MRKTKFIPIILLLTIAVSAFGQNKTFIGVEGSFAYDQFEFIDPGNTLESPVLLTGTLGVLISQQINENFTVEIGYVEKDYQEGFKLVNGDYEEQGYSTNSIHAIQIPLRLISRINLHKEKLFLTPRIGGILNINTDYNKDGYTGTSSGMEIVGNDTLTYYSISDYNFHRTSFLVEAGLGIETKLFKNTWLSFAGSYISGTKKLAQIEHEYDFNDRRIIEAYSISNGSYWNFELALKYSISRFLKPKKE